MCVYVCMCVCVYVCMCVCVGGARGGEGRRGLTGSRNAHYVVCPQCVAHPSLCAPLIVLFQADSLGSFTLSAQLVLTGALNDVSTSAFGTAVVDLDPRLCWVRVAIQRPHAFSFLAMQP
jgi:hypothetical protein